MAKKKNGRKFLTRLILLVVLGVAAYGAFLFIRCWSQLESLARQKEELARQLGELEEQNAELKEEIDFSKTPDFIERMARELFGWVKPGEIKYIEPEGGGGD